MHGRGFEGGVSVARNCAQRQCEGDTGCDGWVAGEQAGVRAIELFHLHELVLLHNAAVIKRMSLFLSCCVMQAHLYGVKKLLLMESCAFSVHAMT